MFSKYRKDFKIVFRKRTFGGVKLAKETNVFPTEGEQQLYAIYLIH